MALGWRSGYIRYKRLFLNIAELYNQRRDIRAFLETLLTLGTIAVFAIFALRPTLLTIANLYQEIKAKEQLASDLTKKAQNLVQAQTIYNQEGTRLSLLSSAMPEKPFPELFVRQLEGLVAKHNVEVLGLTFGKATLLGSEDDSAIKKVSLPANVGGASFSLSAKGTYTSITSFLADLESLRRPIIIDTFSLNVSGVEGKDVLVLVVTGLAPYLK